jgi:phage shock protein A
MTVADYQDDPVRGVEQGLSDLKRRLGRTVTNLSNLRQSASRARGDARVHSLQAEENDRRAIRALEEMRAGRLDKAEAEAQAVAALEAKIDNEVAAAKLAQEAEKRENLVRELETDVLEVRTAIRKLESEMLLLKASGRAAKAAVNAAQIAAEFNPAEAQARIEALTAKIEEDEALAEAWEEIAHGGEKLDREIDAALQGGDAKESLRKMKKVMGLE